MFGKVTDNTHTLIRLLVQGELLYGLMQMTAKSEYLFNPASKAVNTSMTMGIWSIPNHLFQSLVQNPHRVLRRKICQAACRRFYFYSSESQALPVTFLSVLKA